MAKTVLEVLTEKNPALKCFVKKGPNSFNDSWMNVDSWRKWKDFKYKNLFSIYNNALLTKGDPPTLEPARDYDVEIWSEHSLEHFLHRFMIPHVNWALRCAGRGLRNKGSQEVLYLAPGSWVGSADWSLVSHDRMPSGFYANILPGDTKIGAKWYPEMEKSEDQSQRYQWKLPVSQVKTYSVDNNCRYGFIITDLHLVVLRFTLETIGVGSALSRPQRGFPPISHQRVSSDSTDVSSQLGAMSLDSYGAASFNNDDPATVEFQPPEYAIIPWENHGKKQLTIKLSLFCLCLMAAGGEADIDTGYAPLDSWRRAFPRGFRHNTSGLFSKQLPSGATVIDLQAGEGVTGNESHDMNYWAETGEYMEYEAGGNSMEGEDEEGEEGEEDEEDEEDEGNISYLGNEDGEDGEDGEEEEEDGEEEEGDDQSTIDGNPPESRPHGGFESDVKWHRVKVVKQDNRYSFRDVKGVRKKTKKLEWTQVSGGWTYQGRKHVYFTEKLD